MITSISSSGEFETLLKTSSVVITDFYADWCGPCKVIAPTFESLSTKFTKPRTITFAKVNVDSQQEIAQKYGVRAMPTFMIFKNGTVINTIKGADSRALTSAVEEAAKFASPAAAVMSTPGRKLGGAAPAGSPKYGGGRPLIWRARDAIDALIAFLGLYFISLFSLNPRQAAAESPFNINNMPDGTSGRYLGGGRFSGGAPGATGDGPRFGPGGTRITGMGDVGNNGEKIGPQCGSGGCN